jgi:hypothetical protein
MNSSDLEEQRRNVGETVRESVLAVDAARQALLEATRVLERARDVWRCVRERGIQGKWRDSVF